MPHAREAAARVPALDAVQLHPARSASCCWVSRRRIRTGCNLRIAGLPQRYPTSTTAGPNLCDLLSAVREAKVAARARSRRTVRTAETRLGPLSWILVVAPYPLRESAVGAEDTRARG